MYMTLGRKSLLVRPFHMFLMCKSFKNGIGVIHLYLEIVSTIYIAFQDFEGPEDGADNFLIHHVLGRYIGDSVGNVSVLKLNREGPAIELMKYRIPVSEAHGETLVSIFCFTKFFYVLCLSTM